MREKQDAMIYVLPIGGLGNVLRVMKSVYSLRECGFREIQIFWNPNNQQPLEFYEIFKDAIIPVCQSLPNNTLIWKSDEKMIPFEFFSELEMRYENLLITTCFDFFKPDDNTFLKKCVFLDQFQKYTDKLIENRDITVGLHIRRSDFIIDGRELSEVSSFKNLIDKELNINSNTNFFIATDDILVENELKAYIGLENVIIHPKKNGYNRFSKEYTKDGIIDFLALSKCRKIIGSKGSSFSIIASKINDINRIVA